MNSKLGSQKEISPRRTLPATTPSHGVPLQSHWSMLCPTTAENHAEQSTLGVIRPRRTFQELTLRIECTS